AEALPVDDRAEDLGAEQAVTLGLERPVVDGLGLGDLAVRPRSDLLRRGQADPDAVEVVYGPRLVGKRRTLVQRRTSLVSCSYRSLTLTPCLRRCCAAPRRGRDSAAP